MVKGACRNLPDNLKPEDYNKYFHYTICYESWVKTYGEPTEHIYDQKFLDEFCTDHFEKCEIFNNSHTFYEGVKIFNVSSEGLSNQNNNN